MKQSVRIFRPNRVWSLSLSLLLSLPVAIGFGQQYASARISPVNKQWRLLLPPQNVLGPVFANQPPAERVITGTVSDQSNGGPLPGVSVLVKGTTIGTTTDTDGRFRLNVPDGRNTLVLSYIGYATQEVSLANRTSISVSMSVDERSLSEVVVVGYGTQKRSDLTGAVASVKGSDLKNLPATDIATSLQGRVPGALVQQSSGEPGVASSIIIRGPASINGSSQPLYVVDGVPQLNPGYTFNIQDVESIEVLKDASAAAIYGAQAGGGVILR